MTKLSHHPYHSLCDTLLDSMNTKFRQYGHDHPLGSVLILSLYIWATLWFIILILFLLVVLISAWSAILALIFDTYPSFLQRCCQFPFSHNQYNQPSSNQASNNLSHHDSLPPVKVFQVTLRVLWNKTCGAFNDLPILSHMYAQVTIFFPCYSTCWTMSKKKPCQVLLTC